MNRGLSTILLYAVLTALGCSQESDRNIEIPPPVVPIHGPCADVFVAGVVVEVRDALTAEPAAHGARGEIRDGDYVETLREGWAPDPEMALTLMGAWERPGVYSVVVRKDGYRDWSSEAVVEADECHVHTVTLQAALARP